MCKFASWQMNMFVKRKKLLILYRMNKRFLLVLLILIIPSQLNQPKWMFCLNITVFFFLNFYFILFTICSAMVHSRSGSTITYRKMRTIVIVHWYRNSWILMLFVMFILLYYQSMVIMINRRSVNCEFNRYVLRWQHGLA